VGLDFRANVLKTIDSISVYQEMVEAAGIEIVSGVK
jgi:hypothetical protein